MATKFTGGCLCGQVRYECTADPFFMEIATAAIAKRPPAVPMNPTLDCRPQR